MTFARPRSFTRVYWLRLGTGELRGALRRITKAFGRTCCTRRIAYTAIRSDLIVPYKFHTVSDLLSQILQLRRTSHFY